MKVRVTAALKAALLGLKLIATDADDETIKAAAIDAILSKKLSIDDFKKTQEDEDAQKGGKLLALLEKIAGQKADDPDLDDDGDVDDEKSKSGDDKNKTPAARLPEWDDGSLSKSMAKLGSSEGNAEQRSGWYVDVKSVKDMYSSTKEPVVFADTTKSGARHPHAGQNAFEYTDAGKRFINQPSELERAVNGAFIKAVACSQLKNVPRALRLTDHDNELLKYALHEMKWGGVIGGDCESVQKSVAVKNRKLSGFEIKTVIDDLTSGGLEIAPISFDDMVISIPILFGELAPFVNMVPVTRGRRIESATLGNMSLTSSGSVRDDQSIPLFATAGFIAAFDTTIHVVNGAIEVGLDFMSDSPIDIAGHITQKYGELLLAWLDEQIAIGDGVIEPEGIMVASGTTSVSFGAAAPTIGGYEAQLFAVPKRYKQGYDRNRIRFCANETTYSRARGIPVGASDARRLFGTEEENYSILNHGFSIVDAMTNSQGFFANLARYRMYRRLGLAMNMTTEGRELTLRNKMLITARARYGGRLEDGLAAGVTTNHQA